MTALALPSWYSQEQTDCIVNPSFAFTFTLLEERGIKKIGTVSLCHVFAAKDYVPLHVKEWAKDKNVFYVFSNGANVSGLTAESCFMLQLDSSKNYRPTNSSNMFMHSPEYGFASIELVEAICSLFPDREERINRFRSILFARENRPKNYLSNARH